MLPLNEWYNKYRDKARGLIDLEKEVKIMLTVFTQNDFFKTISPIHQNYFKMRFDGMLSEAHSFAARYRAYKEEYDKLQFIEYMKGVFIFQGLGNIPNNPLLDDLTELYNIIYAPYGHMIMTIPLNNAEEEKL